MWERVSFDELTRISAVGGGENEKSYGLVGRLADLLAHELVHPLGCQVVGVAAVGREAGDDEGHGCVLVCVGFWGCVVVVWFLD